MGNESHKMVRNQQHLRFIDLFAGIGGIRLGFESTKKCKCVYTCEWDKDAQETYFANFPDERDNPAAFGEDITKVDPASVPDHDILCGGFPCQPFSSIGKRQGFKHPTQGTLFFNVRNIIAEKRPDAFFLENVPGLETHDDGNTIAVILKTLREELGYDTSFGVLDAADFGAPQYRRRAFFVGFKKDLNAVFRFPEPTTSGARADIRDCLESDEDIAKKSLTIPNYKNQFVISRHLQDVYIWKKDDGHPQIIGDKNGDPTHDRRINLVHGPAKTLCASYHKIQRITGTFVEGGPTGLRMLTELECKRLQGFPDNFKIPVCRTSMYHQFGNSVSVNVISAIARRVVDSLIEARARRDRQAV